MHYLESVLDTVKSTEFTSSSFLTNMAIVFGVFLALGLLGRMLFGKRSGLNHTVSSAIGILFVYMLGVLLYGTSTALSGLLSSLPFVAVRDQMLALLSFKDADWQSICAALVRMVTLAFFVNLLDTLLPRGKNILMWLLYRLITVFLSVLCQALIVWLTSTFLPASFMSYAPVILLGILAAMILLGALKLLLSVALTAVNPIIGALYTFFFSNLVGKQLSKAVLTTLLLSAFVYALNHLGYVVISLVGMSMATLLLVMVVLLALWYLIHHIL